MHPEAFADDRPLRGLRRNDGADAVDAFLQGRIREQRYGNVGFDVVDAYVAWRCTVVCEIGGYGVGIALGDVERYGDGCTAVHGGVGSGGLCGELSGLNLIDDAIEVGVHVGVSRGVELVFKGRDVLVAGIAGIDGLIWCRSGSGCAARLCRDLTGASQGQQEESCC